jgi:hypothetical protein
MQGTHHIPSSPDDRDRDVSETSDPWHSHRTKFGALHLSRVVQTVPALTFREGAHYSVLRPPSSPLSISRRPLSHKLILYSSHRVRGQSSHQYELTAWSWALLEAASCTAIQGLPSVLWYLKVHYRVQKIPPLVPILSHINPIHTSPFYLTSISISFTHLRLGLPSSLFPSHFPTNILNAFLSSPTLHFSFYMPCPSHLPWLYHCNYSWRRAQVMKLLIMQFSPSSSHFIMLWSTYPPQHLLLKHVKYMLLS